MAGPAGACGPAVGSLGPALQAGAFSHPHGPGGAGAGAAAERWGAAGGPRWQLAGAAGAGGLGCRRAVGWPLHRLAGGAAPSTCCWSTAPLLASSGLAIWILGLPSQAGAFLHRLRPREVGAEAAVPCLRAAGGPRWQLAAGAGAAGLRCRGAVGWPLHRLAGGAAPSTCCWCAAPLPAPSGPAVWILGPTLHPGAVLHTVRPRWAGAAAALKHWGAAGGT